MKKNLNSLNSVKKFINSKLQKKGKKLENRPLNMSYISAN